MLTGNGRVELQRTRWHEAGVGGDSPVDALLDLAESTVSAAVRQMACREGIDVRGFERAARNLLQTAQLSISPESLRKIVEAEGKAVLKAQLEHLQIRRSAYHVLALARWVLGRYGCTHGLWNCFAPTCARFLRRRAENLSDRKTPGRQHVVVPAGAAVS